VENVIGPPTEVLEKHQETILASSSISPTAYVGKKAFYFVDSGGNPLSGTQGYEFESPRRAPRGGKAALSPSSLYSMTADSLGIIVQYAVSVNIGMPAPGPAKIVSSFFQPYGFYRQETLSLALVLDNELMERETIMVDPAVNYSQVDTTVVIFQANASWPQSHILMVDGREVSNPSAGSFRFAYSGPRPVSGFQIASFLDASRLLRFSTFQVTETPMVNAEGTFLTITQPALPTGHALFIVRNSLPLADSLLPIDSIFIADFQPWRRPVEKNRREIKVALLNMDGPATLGFYSSALNTRKTASLAEIKRHDVQGASGVNYRGLPSGIKFKWSFQNNLVILEFY
jgi:hypothetical protein